MPQNSDISQFIYTNANYNLHYLTIQKGVHP